MFKTFAQKFINRKSLLIDLKPNTFNEVLKDYKPSWSETEQKIRITNFN